MKKSIITTILLLNNILFAQNYALIIGVPSGFAPNSGIELDINKIKNLLNGFDYQIKELIDPRPKDVIGVLEDYSKKLSKNDNFIFYYSGHGAQIPDINGDERDKKDEVLCLRERVKGEIDRGDFSSFFIDDKLYILLSKINSHKFIFFDSCHSGTAFKSNSKYISKSLGYYPQYKPSNIIEKQPIPIKEREESASLLFFGAAQDGTSAKATQDGSMFTTSIIKALTSNKGDLNGDGKITFKELLKFTSNNIRILCDNNPNIIFTPQMHSEAFDLDSNVIETLTSKSILEYRLDKLLKDGVAKPLEVTSKMIYRDGEDIKFHINTKSNQGYLYIIYINNKEYTLLYPNRYTTKSQKIKGDILFPNQSYGNFNLTAMPPYGKTVVFTIISKKPLNLYNQGIDGIFNIFKRDTKESVRFLRGIGVTSSPDILIAKTIFKVVP